MRRAALAALFMVFSAMCLSATPASAITFGSIDGNAHPNVGGLVSETQYSDGTWIYCSGTLISPTVFLTAAHCQETVRVGVTFDSNYVAGDQVYYGTFYADPLFSGAQSDPHDIAVIVFDEPISGITPALLPTADSLSKTSATQTFTQAGYGAYQVTNSPGGHQFLYNDVRMVATGTLNSISKSWLRISENPSRGNGGGCFGDSGGPNFLGDTNIVAGTTITGDAICRSTNTAYRLDTESARAFLGRFVPLP